MLSYFHTEDNDNLRLQSSLSHLRYKSDPHFEAPGYHNVSFEFGFRHHMLQSSLTKVAILPIFHQSGNKVLIKRINLITFDKYL